MIVNQLIVRSVAMLYHLVIINQLMVNQFWSWMMLNDPVIQWYRKSYYELFHKHKYWHNIGE